MTRISRPNSVDAFAVSTDFNAQIYDALRKSPWWMISIAFHVVLGLALSLFNTAVEATPTKRPLALAATTADELEPEPENEPEPIEPVAPDVLDNPEPIIRDDTAIAPPEKDTDQADDKLSGETEGESLAPFEGPQNNDDLGTGGAAGGSPRGPGGMRDRGTRGRPSGKPKDDAVLHALRWLAAHQSPSGAWEAAGFDAWCDGKANGADRPDGPGLALYDVGVSGLALCAFLGAGYTNRGGHEFAATVRRGLAYLRNVQDPEGCFGPRSTQHFIYNHATASLAMVEAYGMTESALFRGSAQKALDFIGLARNPYYVWRYGVKAGDNDTSVMGWMMMALKSARLINTDAVKRGKAPPLQLDEEAFDGIRSWLDRMTDPDYGRVGYLSRGEGPARPQALIDRFPGSKSESMTAVGLLARIFMHEDPRTSEVIRKGVDLCSKLPPTWNTSDGSIDMYYWYYATLALYQVGGAAWQAWDKALLTSVVANQRQDGTYCSFKGSWDPLDPWGGDGGRVYSTAVLAMCLEAHYRYDKIIGAK